MLVFVDESGDTGMKFGQGSSRYFVVTLVIFPVDDEVDRIRRRIDALRHELHLPAEYEFHFIRNNVAIRRAFLKAVRDYDFRVHSLVVDKTELTGPEYGTRSEFYKAVCGIAFEGASSVLQEATVQFDDSGEQAAKKELASYLKRRINGAAEGTMPIKKIGMQKSRGNNLIQLADMVCGAIYRSRQEEDGKGRGQEYRNIIVRRLAAVQEWPQQNFPGS